MKAARPDWKGRTVVCIASGPSLTAEDCETVRKAGFPTIVTNTTFRVCPWADVLVGFDSKWWSADNEVGEPFRDEVRRTFKGRMLAMSQTMHRFGIESLNGAEWKQVVGSGPTALCFALAGGPSKVVLLGFDTQKTGGKVHHHGDHPKGLSNAASIKDWPRRFRIVAEEAKRLGIPVLNASRETALSCFERVDLAEALR